MATDDYKDYGSNSNHYNDMHHLRRDASGGPWQCHIGKMAFHLDDRSLHLLPIAIFAG